MIGWECFGGDNEVISLFLVLNLSAISITDGARVTLSDVRVNLNQAQRGGGAFISGVDTAVVMEQISFESNHARDGSAIYIHQSDLTIVSGKIRINGRSNDPTEAILCDQCTLNFPQPTQVLISENSSYSSFHTQFVADYVLFALLLQSTPISDAVV